jgi:P27 family predicted phage terminase small subunit
MPANLSGLAVEEWKSIVPQLMELGVLSEIDGKALAAYCECFAQWRRAMEEVEERGILIEEPIVSRATEDVVGYKVKRNPAISIANDNLKLMKSFLVEFGLTPASRGRLKIEKPEGEADPMDAYLAAANQPAPDVVN